MKFIQQYEFINFQGKLDLERFCVYLSACFNCDNILSISPKPRDIYNLLIELLYLEAKNNETDLWIQKQNIVDWKPEYLDIYPDKYRTYIHISGLVKTSNFWIYDIGHNLMNIPKFIEPPKYYEWVKKDWLFVYTFINGYHNFQTNFLKEFDLKMSKKGKHSSFEALSLSMNTNIGYDEAVNKLKSRNDTYEEALNKISLSIKNGYFLEAITLEECLISNCFFNYLKAKKIKNIDTSFFKLLNTFKKSRFNKSIKTSTMIEDLQLWRKKRNTSIHGFVTSRDNNFINSQEEFISFSEETANTGLILTTKIIEWYVEEAVHFIETNFDNT